LKMAVLMTASLAFLTAYLWRSVPSPARAAPPDSRSNCWMTGGGSMFGILYAGNITSDDRVTHGFVVRCDRRNSSLEVVDHNLNTRFHLESLDNAVCIDDP